MLLFVCLSGSEAKLFLLVQVSEASPSSTSTREGSEDSVDKCVGCASIPREDVSLVEDNSERSCTSIFLGSGLCLQLVNDRVVGVLGGGFQELIHVADTCEVEEVLQREGGSRHVDRSNLVHLLHEGDGDSESERLNQGQNLVNDHVEQAFDFVVSIKEVCESVHEGGGVGS